MLIYALSTLCGNPGRQKGNMLHGISNIAINQYNNNALLLTPSTHSLLLNSGPQKDESASAHTHTCCASQRVESARADSTQKKKSSLISAEVSVPSIRKPLKSTNWAYGSIRPGGRGGLERKRLCRSQSGVSSVCIGTYLMGGGGCKSGYGSTYPGSCDVQTGAHYQG